ncbi:WD repeat-containing protein 26 homolog [Vicia villosa]|uniref:WD repeat-containing protein 26 homolog n=1 Tax=Vicia villosa TaxID=3911 RepID=UPI00273C367D|nr:WD repeat-containing protein 26 homolog [Vicia villosa]XP_058762029.1 WD repeat-containing protein 26 homolog [Vicia villosa]
MESVEDKEPALKRAKLSSQELVSLSNGSTSKVRVVCSSDISAEGDDEDVASKGVLKRGEFVRMITKALYSLGYIKSGEHLEEESGISLNSSAVNMFKQQILDGDWDKSVATLNQIGLEDESIIKAASILILEQKFFELLDEDKVMEALKTLRTEITHLCDDSTKIRKLSSCMLSPSGQGARTRSKLLEELQDLIPPTVMIPEKRLEHLVEQALILQRVASLCHNSLNKKMPLNPDHYEGKSEITLDQLANASANSDNNDEMVTLTRADFEKFATCSVKLDRLEEDYKKLVSMLSEVVNLLRVLPR